MNRIQTLSYSRSIAGSAAWLKLIGIAAMGAAMFIAVPDRAHADYQNFSGRSFGYQFDVYSDQGWTTRLEDHEHFRDHQSGSLAYAEMSCCFL